jgi:methanogenic corrinoid protein MtbC1
VNDRAPARPVTLSIAAVERDTGLSKDTLRVWERRYGFPVPERDGLSERAYPLEQVEKLRIIKRLIDGGHRPGRIVDRSLAELQLLSDSSVGSPQAGFAATAVPDLRHYLDLMRAHDVDALRCQLGQAQLRLGLGRFVIDVVAPLNLLVGDAWMRGQLEIFEEHFYTESVQIILRSAIHSVTPLEASIRPRVLLTTFPNEAHGLGLLMAEALLLMEGCKCTSLGVQTPIWDIALAAAAQRSDIVALAFTAVLTPAVVVEGLAELRGRLPAGVEVWAGGAAPVLHRRPMAGVTALGSLSQIAAEVRRWRAARA